MLQLSKNVENHIRHYPTPINLSYFWSIGSALGIFLALQLITGLFLAIHYIPHADYAFNSVEIHIIREVSGGWLVRYIHSNGASIIFILLYAHMARGLYFQSYKTPREAVWISGVTAFILMAAAAFLGYVLPWGQISYWGATVITNIITSIPVIGEALVIWIWGGFSVTSATLTRFFALHFILPFAIAGLALLHLLLLHRVGSSNPSGLVSNGLDITRFFPYFALKDTFVLLLCLIFFIFVVGFTPNMFSHADNYIPANPIVTPAHIVPEWYFLPFYAILRAIPSKLGGAIAIGGSMALLYLLPYLDRSTVAGPEFKVAWITITLVFIFDVLLLGWIGGQAPTPFLVLVDQIATLYYFIHILVIIPAISYYEWAFFSITVDEEERDDFGF